MKNQCWGEYWMWSLVPTRIFSPEFCTQSKSKAVNSEGQHPGEKSLLPRTAAGSSLLQGISAASGGIFNSEALGPCIMDPGLIYHEKLQCYLSIEKISFNALYYQIQWQQQQSRNFWKENIHNPISLTQQHSHICLPLGSVSRHSQF